jgi:hypothetical protein
VSGGILYNHRGVASLVKSGTAYVINLSTAPTGDTNFIVTLEASSNAQAAVTITSPTQFRVQARSSNLNNYLTGDIRFIVWDPS